MCNLAYTIVHIMRKFVIILLTSPMVLWKSEVATVLVDMMVLAVACSVHRRMKHRIMQLLVEFKDA